MKLSIIVPVYNERTTVLQVLERVRSAELPVACQIVIVDDGSTDGTAEILASVPPAADLIIHLASRNGGKGAAVRRGIQLATGDAVVIQDADLELDPRDLRLLLEPALAGQATVVYGSRFAGKPPAWSSLNFWANRALTGATNLLFGARLTDMETCYKLFPAALVKSFRLTSHQFEIEPELTAKALRLGHAIHEVPIQYFPRTGAQGKKMRWRDGLLAVHMLLVQRFLSRAALLQAPEVDSSPSTASGASESS